MPGSDATGSAKTCFVAMPITTPAAYAKQLGDPDHFAHVLVHLFTPALQAAGLGGARAIGDGLGDNTRRDNQEP